jgi:poly(A) polymerase
MVFNALKLSIRLYFCDSNATMNLSNDLNHKVFTIIAAIAAGEHIPSYVIGGFVRDLLMKGEGNAPKDIDILVIGSGIDMAERVKSSIAEEVPLTVFKNF